MANEFSELPICSIASIDKLGDWTISKWNWDLEPQKPNTNIPIPELQAHEFSYEALEKLTNHFTKPVVVRGLFNGSKAIKNWNAEYFEEKYGEEILITVTEGRTEKQYENTDEKRNGFGYQRVMNVFKMKVKNALKYMKQGEKFYISNIDTIFRKNNELLDDLEFTERITPWAYNPYRPIAAQMFLGYGSKDVGNSTGTMLHAAHNANFFVQVHGEKNWRFIDPRYSVHFKPRLGRFVPAAKAGMKPVNVPFMNVVLRPGDCLLNPPYMWHEIVNSEGLVIGVATREIHPLWIARNNLLFHSLTEVRVIPRAARQMIPESQKMVRFMASIPFLMFTMSYITEYFRGPVPHPLFTADYNPCDEHDPNGCTSTFLDKNVYGDEVNNIPFRE